MPSARCQAAGKGLKKKLRQKTRACTCHTLQTGARLYVQSQSMKVWRPILVKIMTIKLHHKSVLIQLQQILWTCCIFLSSLNNTFFSVLVIIFSTMSYFCFHYTNTFFIHTMNYFWVVRRIIFLMCIENYFFILPIIIFRGIHGEFIFGPTMLCGPCSWSGLVRNFVFLSLGDQFENFANGGVLSKRMPRRNIIRERNKRSFHLSF